MAVITPHKIQRDYIMAQFDLVWAFMIDLDYFYNVPVEDFMECMEAT